MIPLPEHIRKLAPYVPGKPIEETRRQYGLKRVVKLASNENPLGASPRARRAMARALTELHRYPDASHHHLKTRLAQLHGVAAEEVALGNGSNDLIDLVLRALTVAGDSIVTSQAAFVAYEVCAQVQGLRTHHVPLTAQHTFDLAGLAAAVESDPRARWVFLPNPNNPTGTWVSETALRTFLRRIQSHRERSGQAVFVALDCAYQEYVHGSELGDPLRKLGLRGEFAEFVVVLRTFSKVHGLAGARAGYLVGPAPLVLALDKIRQPFNVSSVALAGALAALDDTAFVRRAVELNRRELVGWQRFLRREEIQSLPTQANFLLIPTREAFGMSGPELFEQCLRRGVILRPVANYGLMDWIRISVGTPSENRVAQKVLAALRKQSVAGRWMTTRRVEARPPKRQSRATTRGRRRK